ncbi:MAG: MGMT family protein [Candidatus Pacearchaeota archaeon]
MGKFNERCYEILKRIPLGKVVTYKDIADALNSRAYRAVGNAMNKNKNLVVIPCHRVVCSDGSIGGYSKGFKRKIFLLRKEGVEIKNNKIDLKKFRWKIKI